MGVLLTRPLAESERTAERLRELGFEPVVAPLMEIFFLPTDLPAGQVQQAVVLTSLNGARAVAAQPGLRPLLSVRAFAVGSRTAEMAHTAGFADVETAAGEGDSLVEAVARVCRPEGGAIVHVGGRDLAVDVAAHLRQRGFEAHHLPAYEARAAVELPPAAARTLRGGRLDAALLYSPRSARLLLDLAAKAELSKALQRLTMVAMSAAVAEPLRLAGHSDITVAHDNTEDALLEALLARLRRPR